MFSCVLTLPIRTFSNLAESTKSSVPSGAGNAEVTQWIADAQDTMLDLVSSTRSGGTPDPSTVLLQCSAINSVLGGASNGGTQDASGAAGAAFLSKAADIMSDLLRDAKAAVERGGSGDPSISQRIPPGIGDIAISAFTSVFSVLEQSGRNSETQDTNKGTVNSTRQSLKELVDVLLIGSVSGSAAQTVQGSDLSITCIKQSLNDVGTFSLSLPSLNGEPATEFSLPPGLLGEGDALVNIQAIRYGFNILELLEDAEVPDCDMLLEVLINETMASLNATHPNGTMPTLPDVCLDRPSNNISNVISLDFQTGADAEGFEPSDLVAPITIKMPLKFSDLPANFSESELSCGYYDKVEKRWSRYGCEVSDFQLPQSASDQTGYIVCSCNRTLSFSFSWGLFHFG